MFRVLEIIAIVYMRYTLNQTPALFEQLIEILQHRLRKKHPSLHEDILKNLSHEIIGWANRKSFCPSATIRTICTWLDEELDIFLADELVVDVDALDSAIEADIYVLPLAFQGLHLLVAGILIPSVVVHYTAAWFGAVYQHQLF